MSKISFYQVMNEEVLKFSSQLLEKCFQNKVKTFVQVSNDVMLTNLDRMLWTFSQKAFIPHATDKDPLPDKHPIYISSSEQCPIDAQGLMLIGIERLNIKEFERVMIIVDGQVSEEIKKAESFSESLKNLGHEVVYYIQNPKGGWN